MTESSDWRLQGQNAHLRIDLRWKRYRTYIETWEHDHCAFCWTKFVDLGFSAAHRELAEREGHGVGGIHDHEQVRPGC